MSDKTHKRHDWTIEDYATYRAEIVRTAQRKRRALAKENGLCPSAAAIYQKQGARHASPAESR